jgi:glycosidase
MPETLWLENEAKRSLARLFPRLNEHFADQAGSQAWAEFTRRLEVNFTRLFRLYYILYGGQYDFFYHLEDLLNSLAHAAMYRPKDLQALDLRREADPLWYRSNAALGGVCYVDLFAGDLEGIRARIPYFKELGLTYLHLMPLFKVPEGESDGGYAVSSYRAVNPNLGTMEQLTGLGRELRAEGISLVVDLVFNHTADDHEWALKAKAGDPEYQAFYRMYPDRVMPDRYEKTLREIFPDEHPGAFTWFADIRKWVWTTFHSYQWDLNYENPAVFNRMADEMLFLANAGVEVLRLDAVAFVWKKMGTVCENLPEAHLLIQAFNACARIAAPALVFKSEAIVHPDEVVKYIDPDECQLSYNPLLMALLWNTLATRQINLLDQALRERYTLKNECAWVNYVRVHDDIGWTFSDEDAARLEIKGDAHRRFLNAFYTGRFAGSFGRGLPFQENPKTGDARISGTCASLAGLEKALREETGQEVDLAVRRILLIHAIILTTGGIPLIYLGDEIATLNDYTYRNDDSKSHDSRWVHRARFDWKRAKGRADIATPEGQVFQGLQQLIGLRKSSPAFGAGELQMMNTGNPHVLGYVRTDGNERVLALANFSEDEQRLPANLLRVYGLGYDFIDLMNGTTLAVGQDLVLGPFRFCALKA